MLKCRAKQDSFVEPSNGSRLQTRRNLRRGSVSIIVKAIDYNTLSHCFELSYDLPRVLLTLLVLQQPLSEQADEVAAILRSARGSAATDEKRRARYEAMPEDPG